MTRDPLRGLDACVHCGFCLQACPTFVVTGDEADSPRGRIVLMQQVERGFVQPDDRSALFHLDRCLGCRACETACPSGVRYGAALESVRAGSTARRGLPTLARLSLTVMAESRLRDPLLALLRLVRPVLRGLAGGSRVGFGAGMVAATKASLAGVDRTNGGEARTGTTPASAGAGSDSTQPSATVFEGCVMRGLFPHVNAATGRVLAANGYRVDTVPGQGCCGALHAHAGDREGARVLARVNVRAFAEAPTTQIAVNSAGCGAMLKEYGELLADDPLSELAERFSSRVRDVTELLERRGPVSGAPLPLRVAYDSPCHLGHAQRVIDPPLTVLRAVPDLDVLIPAESDQCCGSAGIYSLLQPHLSRAVLERKLDDLLECRPDVVATGNPGCVMQIGAGLLARRVAVPVVHPVELLDQSYRRAGLYRPAAGGEAVSTRGAPAGAPV